VVWPGAVVLAVILFFGLNYLVEVLTHESTDDAFIAGHVISIAPRIAGQVAAVYVRDNQMVHSNDLMVEIDPADYAVVVSQKEAASVSQDANFRTVVAAYELMNSKVATAQASLRKARADADSAEATAKNAQSDFDRSQNLLAQKTISQQEFDSALAVNTKAQADWKSAQENVDEEVSKVDEADKQLAAAFAEKDMAFSQLDESQTNIAAAKLNLSYTRIFAPADGRVTRKAVEAGDYLQTGQEIMSLVPEEVWVVANFKESQLDKMRPGQPVEVEIDALGGKSFAAKVDSIQDGSGAQFSLLPPENATGNFVKVVQRVPVKIIFDEPLPADHTIGPGLSVTPSVQVSKFVLPSVIVALIALVTALAAALIFLAIAGRKNGNG
jgi:membrane fusion protein (multidrug efflux system)